jgi:uncharacterized membrane protein YgcG
MYRSTAAAASALSAALFATVFGLSLSSAPAAAYDDDVDVVCFDINGGSEIECQTIEQLTAECALADPEFTTDECGGLLQSRRPFGLTTSSGNKEKEKHRRDNDSGKGRDRNDGGGNSGGGNSGGGNSGGGNSGGSGPNG